MDFFLFNRKSIFKVLNSKLLQLYLLKAFRIPPHPLTLTQCLFSIRFILFLFI
jgi:hypothetical protein